MNNPSSLAVGNSSLHPTVLSGDQAAPGSHLLQQSSIPCVMGRQRASQALTLPHPPQSWNLWAWQGQAEAAAPGPREQSCWCCWDPAALQPRAQEIKHCNSLPQHLQGWARGRKAPGTVYFTSPCINLSGYLAVPSPQYLIASRAFQ